jgi:hypothetical protein
MKLLYVVGLATLVGISDARATTYNFDFSTINVSGSITTDGATGTLTASDITSWVINQTDDTVHFPSSVNPSNSNVTVTGGGLTATTTGLFFDFSATDNSLVNFSSPNFFGGGGGLSLQFCDAATPCLNQNLAQAFSRIELVLIAPGCCSTSTSILEAGSVEIAAASTVVTPLPPALSLFAMGIGIIGLSRWRARKKTAAVAAA